MLKLSFLVPMQTLFFRLELVVNIFLFKSLWKCCVTCELTIFDQVSYCNQCEILIRYALNFQVMKLLRNTVNVKAKNLDGKTAMDILETDKSPIFPKATRLLRRTKERLLFGPSMSLAGYLSREPSTIEGKNKLLGLNNLSKTKHGSRESTDFRNAILVVAVLIVTATYQAGLSPPGGYWEDDSPNDGHTAGQMTMSFNLALFFYIFNGFAFFSSLYVIIILIIGLPMWMVLYSSIAALGMANYASFSNTFPTSNGSFQEFAVSLVPFVYPVITGLLLCPPFFKFVFDKRRQQQVDFPARYFSSVQKL